MNPVSLEQDMNLYGDMVYRIAYLYVKNVQTAEDIFQDIFIKLFTCNKEFENEEHKKAWLIRVTTNHSINFIKSAWNSKKVDSNKEEVSHDNIEADFIHKEKNNEVTKQLFRLKKEHREVLYFFYYMQMSIKEISALLSVPENTVKTRLHRGKDKLKRKLEGGYFSDEE